jgi:YesN/AraC family two-component response regulator
LKKSEILEQYEQSNLEIACAGLFSRRWKPKKGQKIKGPEVVPDSYKKKNAQVTRAAMLRKEDSEEDDAKRVRARANKYEGMSATQVQLEMEKEHQDEALEGLGNIVSQLKDMTSVMNEEVERQTADIGGFQADVELIDNRVKQSYVRTRYLVGR